MSKQINDFEHYFFVLSGGACGGKTSALSYISRKLTDLGYKVFVVPEAATLLIKGGITPWEFDPILFQEALTNFQIYQEEMFLSMAEQVTSKPVVVICDRGLLDCKAYLSEENFQELLSRVAVTEIEARDRYDAVFYMRTAADGAEEFYTTANNEARTETPEQARELDKKTLGAWIGHPYIKVIGNNGTKDFQDKLNNLLGEVYAKVGLPIPLEIDKKYLIKKPDCNNLLSSFQSSPVHIEQTYLYSIDKEIERRLRKRGQDNDFLYYYTEKKRESNGSTLKRERIISELEYKDLMLERDLSKKPIVKTRYCFIHNNQYFELDIFPFWEDKAILEIKLTKEQQTVDLPDFVEVIEEVTGVSNYYNYALANKNSNKQ